MPRMRALSMSVLLAENTSNNGPLMVIPRSHRVFLSCVGETPDNHYKISLKKQEYGVPDEDSLAELAHAHGIVAPIGKPGTVILFDCNLMHGSHGNITPFRSEEHTSELQSLMRISYAVFCLKKKKEQKKKQSATLIRKTK